ncbi:hypothetical protein DL96DRAFT_1706017 [Flagelloscypha sp. PMI_526]|nr:hypothetical protein DL96DRAFT_1706017 [Flagelloscypha sp. PMI_526]
MSESSVHTKTLVVGGLEVDVFSSSSLQTSVPVFILFLLHGRLRERAVVTHIAEELARKASMIETGTIRKELVVVSFDLPNHGSRMVKPLANQSWNVKNIEKHNELHALDMYSIQRESSLFGYLPWAEIFVDLDGAAKDVSLLMDHLPYYLYPTEERTITDWGVAGISLGGHTAWICLTQDPRISVGIPIIGCPDFELLMTERAKRKGLDISQALPKHLLKHVREVDPVARAKAKREEKVFKGKKILVMCGGDDKLVPWSASEQFVTGGLLDVGVDGVKDVFVQDGVGHECTEEMVQRMSKFLVEHELALTSSGAPSL